LNETALPPVLYVQHPAGCVSVMDDGEVWHADSHWISLSSAPACFHGAVRRIR